MKKLIFLTAITALIATTNAATAQVRVNVNLNVGRPPVVYNQPVYYNDNLGWNGMEDYYYLPDAGVYYNVSRRMYFYPNGSQWMMASCLPARYNGYTWNMGRRVRYNGRPDFVRGGGYRNNVAYGRGYNNGYNNGNRGYAYNNGGYAQRGGGYGNRGGGYDNRGGGYENHGGNGNGNRGGGNYGGGNDNRGGGYENHGGGGNGNHGGGGSYGGGNHGGGHGQ